MGSDLLEPFDDDPLEAPPEPDVLAAFTPRHGKPYVWPTWIAGLVSGEKACQWSAWVRAKFNYAKRPDENENTLTAWTAEHGSMVRATAASYEEAGWTVNIENQNKFTYRGKAALVGGKPDLVVVRDREVRTRGVAPSGGIDSDPTMERDAVIIECKSGKERSSDVVQLAIYMILAPAELGYLSGRALRGELVYKGRVRPVSMADAAQFEAAIVSQIKIAAGPDEPRRTPSAAECAFCNILACPDRAKADPAIDPAAIDGALF